MANSIGTVALQLTANATGVRTGVNQAQQILNQFFQQNNQNNKFSKTFHLHEAAAKAPAPSAISRMMSGAGQFISRAASVAGGILLAKGISEVVGHASELLRLAAETAMEYEQQAVAFEVMTGSAARGKKLLGDLQKLAVETPFTVQEIVSEAKLLKAYGIETEDIVDTIRQLGDVASGTGVDLSRLSLAYGQVIAKGRFQATELRQFTEAGVGVRDFAITARMTTGQFLAAMENGKIGADIVVDTFRRMTSEGGKFYGLMDRLQSTVKGRLSALVESGTLIVQKVGLAAFDSFNVAPFLQKLREEINKLDLGQVTKWMRSAADGLQPIYQGLVALAAGGREFIKAGADSLPTWKEVRENFKGFVDYSVPKIIQLTVETNKLFYAIKRIADFGVSVGNEETGAGTIGNTAQRINESNKALKDWARLSQGGSVFGDAIFGESGARGRGWDVIDAKFRELRAKSTQTARTAAELFIKGGGITGGIIREIWGDEEGYKKIEETGKKAAAAANAVLGQGKKVGSFAETPLAKTLDSIFNKGELGKIAERGGEDFAKLFTYGFDKASKLLSPTYKGIVDEALKDAGLGDYDKFMTNAAGLMVGRARGWLGLEGGLGQGQFNRAITGQFGELQKKFGGEIRNTAPLLESGSQAAISALDAARASADKNGQTLEGIWDTLKAALDAQKEHKRVTDEGAKKIVEAIGLRPFANVIGFPGGG